jgi:serine/threonine protein kinase
VALQIGSYVGPYRLLALLSTGQTSQVWEVLDDIKQQRFALKVLLLDHRSDREQRGFLRHEHMVAHKLDHPHIIRALELGSSGGDPYLILELFKAPNLKTILLREPDRLPRQGAQIVEQAAEALSHLHQKGWVHRDIKPDNLLVSAEGEVKLIDFALATRQQRGLARLLARRTKVQGTRSYLSPEQIRGQPLDQRADIYSFGCMLFEMFSGKPPFTGISTNELLNKHLKGPIPGLEAANRNLSPEFAALVRMMLSKLPKNRPQSMDDFLKEFKSIRLYKHVPARKEAGK